MLRKLSALELHRKLNKLAERANSNYRQSNKALLNYLSHAKGCGDALNEARQLFPKRGGWVRWVKARFEGSYRTVKVYMVIARGWNDPRLVELREKGITPKSIKGVYDLLTGKKTVGQFESENDKEISMLRQSIREQLAEAFKGLCKEELRVFDNKFSNYWEALYKEIYRDVCRAMEFDLNEYLVDDSGMDKEEIPNYSNRVKWIRENKLRVKQQINNALGRSFRRRQKQTAG